MNERIKEIAKQAGGHNNVSEFRGYYLLPSPDYIDPATVDLEKFAELIVRECANRCEQSPYPYPNYSVAIKKHFGIEDE